MNIKGNPLESYENGNYRRDVIWDYEEKVDREKARWRELAKQTREKCNEGIRRKFANEPGYAREKVDHMLANGGNAAREKIAKRRAELKELIDECGCVAPVTMTWDKQDKAMAYFKKLKEARDRMKAEREKSL